MKYTGVLTRPLHYALVLSTYISAGNPLLADARNCDY